MILWRSLIGGTDPENPKPKSIKITKSNSIPERGTIYDFLFEKKASGVWSEWMDLVNRDRVEISATAKVGSVLCLASLTYYLFNLTLVFVQFMKNLMKYWLRFALKTAVVIKFLNCGARRFRISQNFKSQIFLACLNGLFGIVKSLPKEEQLRKSLSYWAGLL